MEIEGGQRQGLTRAEIISLIGVFAAIVVSAGGALITYGGQNAKVELLQATVINLNTTVTTLNQTLYDTREEVSALKAQREGTEKALSDLKSTIDRYIQEERSNGYKYN